MPATVRARRGRPGVLALSAALVLLTGGLGLATGRSAGDLALQTHRADRLAMQRDLGALTTQWAWMMAGALQTAVVSQAKDGQPSWPAAAGDPASAPRLAQLRSRAPVFDDGFVLMSAKGLPLAADLDDVPDPADPAWASLRAALTERDHPPVSGVLHVAGRPAVGVAVDVQLSDGTRGLVVGVFHGEPSSLQSYTSRLAYGRTGSGWVVDGRGYVLAAKDFHDVGRLLPDAGIRRALLDDLPSRTSGIVERDGVLASYAAAGRSGWVSVTTQSSEEFAGPLVAASRRAQLAVLALLLIAGTGLVVLHRRKARVLQQLSVRDELTRLYNRRGWFEQAELELSRAARSGQQRVVAFVDVDGLKQVNDVLGHKQGDRAIREAAEVLSVAFRGSDVVGRLGGDEFVVLLGTGGNPAVARERLATALADLNGAGERPFELRLSVGLETWSPTDPCSVDELVRRADAVMYVEKQARPRRHEGLLRVPAPRSVAREQVRRP